MTIGIYKLVFKGLEDWPYVGQSVNIESRLNSHIKFLEYGKANKLLLEAYEISGNPTIEILEECKIEELDEKEKLWIKLLNSVNNGLNITYGGTDHYGSGVNHAKSKYTREQIIKGMKLLLNPKIAVTEAANIVGMNYQALYQVKAGLTHLWFAEEFPEIFEEVNSIGKRCIPKTEYNESKSKYTKEELISAYKDLTNPLLDYSEISHKSGVSLNVLYSIAKGRSHLWLQEEFPKEWIQIQQISRAYNLTYDELYCILVGPKGEEVEIFAGPVDFAKSINEYNNAFLNGIRKVIKKEAVSYKGWYRKDTPEPIFYFKSENLVVKVPKSQLSAFYKKHNLSKQAVSKLIHGTQKETKGWRLVTKVIFDRYEKDKEKLT